MLAPPFVDSVRGRMNRECAGRGYSSGNDGKLHGHASLGTVVTLGTVLTMRLYGSVANLGNLNVNVLGSMALFQRLFVYLDLPHEVADAPQARPAGHAARGDRV